MAEKTTTKAQLAHKKIRKLLLTGQMAAGSRTTLRALAEQLSMSVVPVSEAVRRLEQEGLVIAKPQSGIFVVKLSQKKQHELAIVRQALESQAARLITRGCPKSKIESLRKLAAKIPEYQSKGKPQLASFTDWEFHVKLVAASGCRMLNDRYDSIAAVVMVSGAGMYNNFQETGVTHLQVVQALEKNDPDFAAETIRRHLRAEENFLGIGE